MSALIIDFTLDWVMHRTTEAVTKGIRWTPFITLDDLDFADNLALIFHTHRHMQNKTDKLFSIGQ